MTISIHRGYVAQVRTDHNSRTLNTRANTEFDVRAEGKMQKKELVEEVAPFLGRRGLTSISAEESGRCRE